MGQVALGSEIHEGVWPCSLASPHAFLWSKTGQVAKPAAHGRDAGTLVSMWLCLVYGH